MNLEYCTKSKMRFWKKRQWRTRWHRRTTFKFRFIGLFVFAQTKAFSLRRRCPEGADEVEKLSNSPKFSVKRNILPHTSSVGYADSFSSRRSLCRCKPHR